MARESTPYPKAIPAELGLDITSPDSELHSIMEKYCAQFIRPIGRTDDVPGSLCPRCGAALSGTGGTFVKSMRKDEGRCGKCLAPARENHRIRDAEGHVIVELLGFPLVYHPESEPKT